MVLGLVVRTRERGRKRRDPMGKAVRSTILQLDLSARAGGGANKEKRAALEQTSAILTKARTFFLAHHARAEREGVLLLGEASGDARGANLGQRTAQFVGWRNVPSRRKSIRTSSPDGISRPAFQGCSSTPGVQP